MSEYHTERSITPIVYNWEPVMRGTTMKDAVYIGIRKSSINFSAGFAKLAELASKNITHVQMYCDSINRSVSFRFMTKAQADKMAQYMGPITNIYTLAADGGPKKKSGKKKAY